MVVIWFFPPCFVLLLLPFMMLRSYPHIIARVVWSTSSQLSACPQPKPERTMMIFIPYYIPFASTEDTVLENYPKLSHLHCPVQTPFFYPHMGISLTVKNGRSSRKDDTYSCDFQKKCSSSWCWTPYRICKCSGPPDYRLRSDNGHTDDEHFENLMYISATTTKAIIAKSLFQWFLLMIPALLSRSLCGNHTDAAEIYFPFLDTQDYFVYIALLLFLYFFFSDWALQMGIWFTATTLTQEVG